MSGWVSLSRASEPISASRMEKGVASSYRMPVRLEVGWQIAEPRGVPGARVSLWADLVLPAVEVCMSLRTRGLAPGPPKEDVNRYVCLVPLGTRVARRERRVCAAPPGSSLTMRVADDSGRPLTTDCPVGPTDGSTRHANLTFTTPVDVYAWVAPSVGARAQLAVRGELSFKRGISLQFSAHAASGLNSPPMTSPTQVRLVGPGATLFSVERKLDEGCPAEAWVTAGFVDEWGHELSDRCLLGRYSLP